MSKSKTYSHIINKSGRSYELARQMIPVLISWAQDNKSPQYYSTLSKTIGHNTSRIGYQLGIIGEIFDKLRNESGKDIPILNALVINKGSKRPSDGLGAVMGGYDQWDEEKQKLEAQKANDKAYAYKDWSWVLNALGLLPFTGKTEENIRKGSYKNGASEGPYHKKLKKYVLEHPNEFSISDITIKENEHVLLSGDCLDVFFKLKNGKQIAIEVKSRISDDADILRGIYQCVKYKAVLSAECQAHGLSSNVDAFLVTENELSEENKKTANMLSVKYIVFNKI